MKAVQQKWFVIVAMAAMLCLAGLVMSGEAIADRCVDNGDGTVTDTATNLMWQKATGGPMDWNAAMSYASSLSLGGHSGWGMPNKDELYGLYNSRCNSRYFPMMEVVSSDYWSSTTFAGYTSYAWHVDFNDGYVYGNDKSSSYYVRAVRAGQ